MNQDYLDMLGLLCAKNVEFLVVGAHAMAAYRTPRATADIDFWIRPTPENARRVWEVLAEFGAPLGGFSVEDFADPTTIAQFGVAPVRVDLMTSVTGLDFEQAWANRIYITVDGLSVPVLGKADLIRNKRATGRPKDQLDADLLESI